MKNILAVIGLMLLVVQQALGSHLVGGEVGIEHVEGASYKVFLIMYYDDLHGATGTNEDQVTVNLFEKGTNKLVRTLTLPKVSSTPIAYNFPVCVSANQQTLILRYENEFLFPGTEYKHAAGYYISWERCCRNQDVMNIEQPFESGMVFYMEFPAFRKNGANIINSTPQFSPVTGDFLCMDELYTFSFAATDKDGDELSYSLVTPLKGFTSQQFPYPTQNAAPYPFVVWKPDYSATNAIQGNPALTINANTGLLTVRPWYAGLHVFTVLVEEYRNGEKIGESRRDFQYRVVECQQNEPPVVSLLKPDGSLYIEGQVLEVTSAENQCYQLEFRDKLNSNLTFAIEPVNFTSPVLSITPGSGTITQEGQPVKAELCWPDCSISRPEPYIFDVVVTDKACPLPKTGRLRVRLLVNPVPNDPPVIETSLGANFVQHLVIGQPITFTVTGTDPDSADLVSLTAQGQGFSMQGLGMQFTDGAGIRTFTANFSWTPNCNALDLPQPLRVVFTARDNSCFSQNQDTTSVLFYLSDIENNEANFLPPNIFSPNGDGLNDTFAFPTLPADNCSGRFEKTEVYNRWGEKIYSTTSRTAVWDAAGVPDGIYYYLIRYGQKVYKGTVTVVR